MTIFAHRSPLTALINCISLTPLKSIWLAFAILLAGQQAIASVIGFPSADICLSSSAGNGGSTVTTSGQWANPARPGTSWSIYYIEGSASMLVYWHTFDVNRRPIWYFAGSQQWNTDGTWSAPLKKVQWIPGNGSPTITDVGNVAFTRLIQAPTKLALRWQLSDQTGNQTGVENECIHDFSRDAGVPGRANTTYTGQWYEPDFEGYGLSFNIQEYPGRFEEIVYPEVYDSTGAPTWMIGQRPNATATPPPNTSESYPLLYVYSNYPGGIPTAASAACATTSTCFGFVSGAGTFMREFSSTLAGTWRINIANYFNAVTNQSINWQRPAGSGSVAIAKITQVTQIEVSRTECAIAAGATSCTVGINWGTRPGVTGYPVRQDFSGTSGTTTVVGTAGVATQNLTAGFYQYQLYTGPNATGTQLASSAVVQVTQLLPEPLVTPEFATPPSEDFATTAVGATAGISKVDESGNFNYSLPIMVGKGVGDFKPSFALSYVSGRGIGRAGMGWDLQGLEGITQCRKTIEAGDGYNNGAPFPEVRFESTDQFCLNGARLLLVSGSFGAVDSSYKTEFDSYQRIRIISVDAKGPYEWRVESADGTSRYFGGFELDVPFGLGKEIRRVEPVFETNPIIEKAVAWPLREIANSVGRVIRYRYGRADNDQWLSRVEFDGGALSFQYQILPILATPGTSTYASQFQAGVEFGLSRRLTGVTVYSPSAGESFLLPDVTELRRYELTHSQVNETPTAGDENPALQFVTSIRECVGTTCLRPVVFNYAKQSHAIESYNLAATEISAQRFGDINGDGRLDLLVRRNSNPNELAFYMAKSKPDSQWFQPLVSLGTSTSIFDGGLFESDRSLHLLDLNSDGRDDLIYLHLDVQTLAYSWRARLSNGIGFVVTDTDLVSDPASTIITVLPSKNRKAQLQFSDLNGDGLEDMIYPATAVNRFVVRYLQKPEGQAVAKFGPEVAIDFYNAFNQGCATIDAAFAKLNNRRLEIFDFNGDGFGDFIVRAKGSASNSCRDITGDTLVVNTIDRAQLPSSPPVVDGEKAPEGADPQFIYVFINEGRDCPNSNSTGAPSNSSCTAAQKFRVAEKLPANNGAAIPEEDDLVRFTDVNGDGLADLTYYRFGAYPGWEYRLNTGVVDPKQPLRSRFRTAQCVIPGAFIPGATQERCINTVNTNDAQFVDIDGDGRLDFLWLTANASKYQVRYWTGNGYKSDELTNFTGHTNNSDWNHTFTDLDADGHLDLIATKRLGNPFMSVHRRVSHHSARHQMVSVKNGLGADTIIDYQPLTYRSVYARSYDASALVSGRGSPVLDVLAPTWVVSSMSSASPSVDLATGIFNQNATSSVFYRYGGLKMQTGGRGALGFRQVYSYDPQNKIVALTQYRQGFPYTGIAERTLSWITAATPSSLSVCSVGNGTGPESVSCMAHGAENMVPTPQTPLLSDTNDSTFISIGGVPVTPALIRTTQGVLEVKSTSSESFKFNLDGQMLSGNRDNIDLSLGVASTASKTFWDTAVGGSNRTIESSQNSQNTYASDFVDANRWFINRLTATVTQLYLSGDSSGTRHANFTYEPSTGLIASESIGSPALSSKHYCRDVYGNVIKTIAQSGSLPAPDCASFGAANVISATSNSVSLFARLTAMGYNASGRFGLTQKEVVNTAGGKALLTLSEIKYDAVAGRTAMDAFGSPQYVESINGAKARSAYNQFGEKYFSSSNTGSSMLMRRRWCDQGSDLRCPADIGAVFVSENATAGAATTWQYFDVLGREILSIQQGFQDTQFVAVRTIYDRLSRVAKVSEPFFTYTPGAASGPLPGALASGTQYWNSSYFDALGRVTRLVAANDAQTTTQYVGLTTTVTHPVNGSGLTETKSETKDLLGRVASVVDALGNQVSYEYWNLSDLKSITTTPAGGETGTITTFVIDEFGRRTSSTDPNKGNYTFTYNDAGEVVKQTAGDGSCMLALHDFAGRVTERYDVAAGAACSAGSAYQKTVTSFDVAANGIGLVSTASLLPINGTTQDREVTSIVYDSFGRGIATTQRIQDERTYLLEAKFDQFGRPAQNYFSGQVGTYFGVNRAPIPSTGEHLQYNARGYPEHLRNVYRLNATTPGKIYRETKTVDARGNVTEEVLGNNASKMTVYRGYADNSGWLTQIKTGAEGSGLGNPSYGQLQDLFYSYDLQGNVSSRSDRSSTAISNEAFSYDQLQRLNSTTRNFVTEAMSYYNTGNIKTKYNLAGQYFYDRSAPSSCQFVTGSAAPGAFALTRIGTGSGSESFCYDRRGNQIASFADGNLKRTIRYSSFDAATSIVSNFPRAHVTRFQYGIGHQRLRRYDIDGTNAVENSQGQVTHYVGDAEVLAKADGRTEVRRYVSGMTQLQVIQPGISPYTKQEYLLTDALGSTHRIVDAQGELAFGNTSKQAFATFGERANADDRSTLSEFDQANFNSLLPRGYTGHQQADEVGVVHMNGRIYDPRLGRFLQADSVMEDIFDPQALNSYSYVRNNPMNATDPTGHWRAKEQGILRQVAAIVITIATGVHVNGILAKAAVAKTTAAAAALTTQAAAVAAVGGALSGGVASGTLKGALLGALGGFTFHQIGISSLGSTERVFAHALAGGTLEVLGGGKFGHGFVSAGLSKALSPLADTGDVFSDGLVNAAIGGTVSEITGGDFGNGAVMAATQYAFNALAQAPGATADPYSSIPKKELNDPRALRNGVKSFNESLTKHQEKLRLYRENPMRHDNTGRLQRALDMKENGRFLKIYNERIYELNRQMADIRLQIGQRVERLMHIGELPRPSHIPTQVQPPEPFAIRLLTRVGVLLSTALWSSPAY